MADQFVILHEFWTDVDAHVLKTFLEEEKIPVFLQNEHFAAMNPHLAMGSGGIKLLVRAEDESRARAIMAERDFQTEVQPIEEDVCLACGAAMPETEDACPKCGWSYGGGSDDDDGEDFEDTEA